MWSRRYGQLLRAGNCVDGQSRVRTNCEEFHATGQLRAEAEWLMGKGDVRVAVFGAGAHAVTQHIPNLLANGGAEIVAICDINEQAAQAAAQQFGIAAVYTDGLEMVDAGGFDAMWSMVPAPARPVVEIAAADKGIHIFCEKPQTMDMKQGLELDAALRRSGALGTVCFRERYRPLFQEAKRLLADKEIVRNHHPITGSPGSSCSTTTWAGGRTPSTTAASSAVSMSFAPRRSRINLTVTMCHCRPRRIS